MLIKMSKANWIPTVANLMQVLIKMSKKGTCSSLRVQLLHTGNIISTKYRTITD